MLRTMLISLVLQALFERALSAKQTQQCALLWRAYIGYELSRGRPEAARRVFLRAIHACPWCKVGLRPSQSTQQNIVQFFSFKTLEKTVTQMCPLLSLHSNTESVCSRAMLLRRGSCLVLSYFLGWGLMRCYHGQALWMDGLVSLGDVVSARERADLMDVMHERDVFTRTDTYEILLESIGEQQLV